MAKSFLYKIYKPDGTYITTLTDVASDINYSNEINTAGGQLTIKLARNAGDYGEGSEIDFGNKVKIYVIDKEEPLGKLIFQGFISSFTPIYKDDSVEVILLSYGAILKDYIIEDPPQYDLQITVGTNTTYVAKYCGRSYGVNNYYDWTYVGQTFKPTVNQYLRSISLKLRKHVNNNWQGTRAKIFIQIGTSYEYEIFGYFNTELPFKQDNMLGKTKYTNITSTTAEWYDFTFEEPVYLTAGTQYFFFIAPELVTISSVNNMIDVISYSSQFDNIANDYTNGDLWEAIYVNIGSPPFVNQGISPSPYKKDMLFKTSYNLGKTTVPYNSYEPGEIMKSIIDLAFIGNDNINYNNTIDDTNTVVSYTFSTNTIYEGISKCVELAPEDWYWYLDYSTNYINFHKKNNTYDHVFSLQKDIIDAKFEKRIEDIINTIYFTGGDIGGGVNLYKKYTIAESVAKYGTKAMKYSDQRVTLTATADTIANSILENKSQPELRVTLEILDSNNEQGLGYDIESINVGDTIAVRNITQQVGLSTWDYARWDSSYWDYNIFNLSSLTMQVVKITYKVDTMVIEASTMAVDVNKRIEDINRNLEALQNANNPTNPT